MTAPISGLPPLALALIAPRVPPTTVFAAAAPIADDRPMEVAIAGATKGIVTAATTATTRLALPPISFLLYKHSNQ